MLDDPTRVLYWYISFPISLNVNEIKFHSLDDLNLLNSIRGAET